MKGRLAGPRGACKGLTETDALPNLPPIPAAQMGIAIAREVVEQMAERDDLGAADRYKLRGIADIVSYLKSFIAYGPDTYDAEDLARINATLDARFTDVAEARTALCDYARTVAPADARGLVAYLSWRSRREDAIMRTSLNERADNAIVY